MHPREPPRTHRAAATRDSVPPGAAGRGDAPAPAVCIWLTMAT